MADDEESRIVPSPPMEPDSSENAPLLQEQENQNEDLGPPPPFVASKLVKRKKTKFAFLSSWKSKIFVPLNNFRPRSLSYVPFLFVRLLRKFKVKTFALIRHLLQISWYFKPICLAIRFYSLTITMHVFFHENVNVTWIVGYQHPVFLVKYVLCECTELQIVVVELWWEVEFAENNHFLVFKFNRAK